MTNLAKLLAAKEPLFDHALMQLEQKTGKSGADAMLTAEIAQRASAALKALGLSSDSTPEDIYDGLIRQVKSHDEHLAAAIGGMDPANLAEMIPKIVKKVSEIDLPKDGFFIKTSVGADLLRQNPPQKIMSRLGYTDIEAMLKRENIYELHLALRFAESGDWLNQFNAQYTKLAPSDFEKRDIQLVSFDPGKWGDIAHHFIQKKLHNITNSKEMGAIAVMPMTISEMPGITLKVLPLIIHYFNEIRLYSAFFKLISPKSNFGQIVAETLIADTPNIPIVVGTKIHWRVIQRYFGKLKDEPHPEIFEPHVHPEDLHWRKAEEVLYEIDPELKFWQDLDFVGILKGDEIVSFNLMDVALSYSNELSFSDRYIYHFRESLWNEIFARYLGQKTLQTQLLEKLDNAIIAPENLKL